MWKSTNEGWSLPNVAFIRINKLLKVMVKASSTLNGNVLTPEWSLVTGTLVTRTERLAGSLFTAPSFYRLSTLIAFTHGQLLTCHCLQPAHIHPHPCLQTVLQELITSPQ